MMVIAIEVMKRLTCNLAIGALVAVAGVTWCVHHFSRCALRTRVHAAIDQTCKAIRRWSARRLQPMADGVINLTLKAYYGTNYAADPCQARCDVQERERPGKHVSVKTYISLADRRRLIVVCSV